ncbi:MAG: ABC transporter substrate-binding protein [bacterium]
MKKIMLLLLAVIVISAGLLYVRNSKSQGVIQSNPELTEIKFGYMPFATNWAVYVAQRDGFFEKNGVKAELIKFNVGTEGADALIRGDIKAFAISTFTDLFNIQKRSPGQLKLYTLQVSSNKMHGEYLIAKSGSGIEKVTDLKGKKIGVTPGTLTTAMVKQAYGDVLDFNKSVTIVPLAPNLHLQSLESGQIDALLAFEPTATLAKQKGIGIIIDDHPWTKVAEPFPVGGVTLSASFIEENPELAKNIAGALKDAILFGRSNPDKITEAVAEFTGLDPSVVAQISYNEDMFGEEVDPKTLSEASGLYAKLGVVEGTVDTDKMLYVPQN